MSLRSEVIIRAIPASDRISFLYAEKGVLELDGHAVVLRQDDLITHMPIGMSSAVLLMPGVTVTHAAVKACAEEGALLIWTGEEGVRCYSAGNPGGAAAGKLLRQAALRLDEGSRLTVARKIFHFMFDEDPPSGRSIEQMRGLEGSKVKALYRGFAEQAGICWDGRSGMQDTVNQMISGANAALYGLVEAVILALGYSPAIGFVHSGDERSFVFDVADCLKFQTVVPFAFNMAKNERSGQIEGSIRRGCRDLFRRENITAHLVEIIEDLMDGQTGRGNAQ